MIRMDHTHAMAVFHRYKATTSNLRKSALVRNVCVALEVHARASSRKLLYRPTPTAAVQTQREERGIHGPYLRDDLLPGYQEISNGSRSHAADRPAEGLRPLVGSRERGSRRSSGSVSLRGNDCPPVSRRVNGPKNDDAKLIEAEPG
jgi:hypothetical protein